MKLYRLQNFISTTQQEFQNYQAEPISEAQAIDIQNNLFGVVDLLLEWSHREDCNKNCA